MQNKVIIYGGAFNPPTIAHQAIIKELIRNAETTGSELWIMPSGTRLDKSIEVAIETRLAYIEAVLAGLPGGDTVEIETSELYQTTQTETYETVRSLSSLYPDRQFVWVFGTDSVVTMQTWRGGEWLYGNLEMLLIAREGYHLKSLPPKSTVLNIRTPVISSTKVRNLIQQELPFHKYVPSSVYKVITGMQLIK